MDFLDPKKKRARNIRLIIGYILVGTALILASILLLLSAFGYGISSTGDKVVQNGLVFVDAHPEQATMYLNGVDKGGTDGRFVLEANRYTLELKRSGYRDWKRDFTLNGGVIVRLVYPFLFPEKLQSKDLLTFGAVPDVASASPDRRWIVLHSAADMNRVQVLDTSKKELPVETLTLPPAVLGSHAGAQQLEAVEWSTDNRHLLLKHTFVGGYDYLILDREDASKTVSISQTFGRSYTNVTLRDKKADQLYLYQADGGVLQSASVRDETVEAVASDVLSFWPYKDNLVLYATNKGASEGKSLIKIKEAQVTFTIREVVRAPTYLLNMAAFDGEEFVVAGSTADGKVYVYKEPLASLKRDTDKELFPALLMKVDGAQYVSFSNNARFVAVQGGSKFALYDFETTNSYRYDTQLPLVAGQKATWMDGHRLLLNSGDKVIVWDYDGINQQTLVSANAGLVPLFDRDYNQLFTVGPSLADKTKPGLVRTDLNLGTE